MLSKTQLLFMNNSEAISEAVSTIPGAWGGGCTHLGHLYLKGVLDILVHLFLPVI